MHTLKFNALAFMLAFLCLTDGAQAQGTPVPTDVWFQSMFPLMTVELCKPDSPFRKEFRDKKNKCDEMVAYWMQHCYMGVLRNKLPPTLKTQQDGVKAGEILGLCVYQSQQKENSAPASSPTP